jgi:hypothetical protein
MKRSISIAMLMVFVLMLLVTMGSALAQDPPVGAIVMWPTGTVPDGWLLCNGQAVSRTQYSALYNIITTTFGAGDGSTTFNLPNFTGRSPQGPDASASEAVATPVGVKMQTLVPQHRHTRGVGGSSSPAGAQSSNYGNTQLYTGYTGEAAGVDQRGPRLVVNFIIKYEESASTPTPTATPTPGPTPTLTPTPLPEWVITDTLSSGTVVMIDRSVSYGQVITAGALLAAAAAIVFGIVQYEAHR